MNAETISVIIPTLNASRQLPELLLALRAQTTTPPEILVVDPSSGDGSAHVILNEDTFLCPKLIRAGHTIAYAADARQTNTTRRTHKAANIKLRRDGVTAPLMPREQPRFFGGGPVNLRFPHG